MKTEELEVTGGHPLRTVKQPGQREEDTQASFVPKYSPVTPPSCPQRGPGIGVSTTRLDLSSISVPNLFWPLLSGVLEAEVRPPFYKL